VKYPAFPTYELDVGQGLASRSGFLTSSYTVFTFTGWARQTARHKDESSPIRENTSTVQFVDVANEGNQYVIWGSTHTDLLCNYAFVMLRMTTYKLLCLHARN
jgi:hypothetical protein